MSKPWTFPTSPSLAVKHQTDFTEVEDSSVHGAIVSESAFTIMAGWSCRLPGCSNRTHRRPPNNICFACRSSRRGRHNEKPQQRFVGKRQMTAEGVPKPCPAKKTAEVTRRKPASVPKPCPAADVSAVPSQDGDGDVGPVRGSASDKEFRGSECLLLMALPFSRDLA